MMKRIFIIYFFLLFLTFNSFAQKRDLKFKADKVVSVNQDSVSVEQNYFYFKNINLLEYYYDQKKIKKLYEAQKLADISAMYSILEDYVMNFGILNFTKDQDMLWMLGQFDEKNGNFDKAAELYRYAIKNNIKKKEFILNYYDSLTQNSKDYYVPLDYYYQLVDYRKAVDTLRPPRGVFINIGPEINSRYHDYAPALSADNNILVFTSKRNVNLVMQTTNEDLYFSKYEDSAWTEAQPFNYQINSQFNEGSACISKDGQTLYFVRCNSLDGLGNCDIFEAKMVDGKWAKIRNMGDKINSNAWDSHPSLSKDEKSLYFASDRFGGFGFSDIYVTEKDAEGNWSEAKNLGPMINTAGNDVSPFYHPVYDILYFSSDGQMLNFGKLDIYKSKKIQNGWKEPMNVGPLVNGTGDEYYFTIDKKANFLYYARSELNDDQGLEIYSFPLPMEARPNATTVLKGTLKDSLTNKALRGIITIIDLDDSIEVAPKYLRPDGSFSFNLINKNRYLIIVQGDDFFSVEKQIYVTGDTIITVLSKFIDVAKPIVFRSIDFHVNSSEITPEMIQSLYNIMTFMLDNPSYKLKISGHTDSDGEVRTNVELSFKRANAIKEYLIQKGKMSSKKVTAFGYGSSFPIVPNDTEENKRLNRRVEFEILKD